MLCERCQKELTGYQSRWCSEQCSKLGLKALYKKRNREKVNAYNRQYRSTMLKGLTKNKASRLSKMRMLTGKADPACMRCNATEDLQFHHIKRRIEGGDNSAANITVLCSGCHRDWHYLLDKIMTKYWEGKSL